MDYLSLFSGAGGGDLAMQHLLGFKCRGYVEYEPYCQEVIKQRITDGLLDAAPIFGDIRAFVSEGYAESYRGMVSLITGGFPCQDISCAGTRRGLGGERSGLWGIMFNIIRTTKPKYVLVENSPMLTIRGLGTVLRDLAEVRYDTRWCCLSASIVGAPHIRDRVWIMAHPVRERFVSIRNINHGTQGTGFNTTIGGKNWNIIKMGQKNIAIHPKEWSIPPEPIRVVDGVPNQLDRLKAIGNAQVPIVAATAWDILSGCIR